MSNDRFIEKPNDSQFSNYTAAESNVDGNMKNCSFRLFRIGRHGQRFSLSLSLALCSFDLIFGLQAPLDLGLTGWSVDFHGDFRLKFLLVPSHFSPPSVKFKRGNSDGRNLTKLNKVAWISYFNNLLLFRMMIISIWKNGSSVIGTKCWWSIFNYLT